MKKKIIICVLLTTTLILFSKSVYAAGEMQSRMEYNDYPLMECNSIVVDSKGNIYLTNNMLQQVQVYNNSKFIYSISVNTSGDYVLSIDDNDNLLVALAREDIINVYDQNGNLILQKPSSEAYNKYSKRHGQYQTTDGIIYKINEIYGYISISKEDGGLVTKAFSMPIWHWIIKFFLNCMFYGALLSGITILIFSKLSNKKGLKEYVNVKFSDYYSWVIFKKPSKFNLNFIEINYERNEFIRRICTLGAYLIVYTFSLSSISSIGYSSIGFEYLSSFAFITIFYVIVNTLFLCCRYYFGYFEEKNNKNFCEKCKKCKPEFWSYVNSVKDKKIKCIYCNDIFYNLNKRGLEKIISIIPAILAFVIIMSILHIPIPFKVVISIAWSAALWYISVFIFKVLQFKKTNFHKEFE